MSTDFYPLTPIRMADLFARLKSLGVHENLCQGTAPDEKCLTDGQNFVWLRCSGRELVSSFTSCGKALSDQPSDGFRARRLPGFTGAPAINSVLKVQFDATPWACRSRRICGQPYTR
jgi:hypothetical protein